MPHTAIPLTGQPITRLEQQPAYTRNHQHNKPLQALAIGPHALGQALAPNDQNLTRCAERTNAFNACSSSEDDHLSTPSISPHGVHYKRRGRCQIPWRMSTHLPTQRCKVSITADNTNSPRLHSKSLAAPARATPPWRSPSAQRPHPPPCSSWRIQLAPTCSLPSYIEGATYATITSSI